MARLTKNNKRSIKSTWREINWHVEGSVRGAAAGAGRGGRLPRPPHTPSGPPRCPAAGSLVPRPGRRRLASSRTLASSQPLPVGAVSCGTPRGVPWALPMPPWAPGTPKCHGTPLLCQPGEQAALAQPPRRAAPALRRPMGRRGGDVGTPGTGAGPRRASGTLRLPSRRRRVI